jgi:hypothetical protein
MTSKRKQRVNYYVDLERHDALRSVASMEDTSISDLVREGIDRVIADRMNNPRPDRAVLRDQLKAFLERYADSVPALANDESEENDEAPRGTGQRVSDRNGI